MMQKLVANKPDTTARPRSESSERVCIGPLRPPSQKGYCNDGPDVQGFVE